MSDFVAWFKTITVGGVGIWTLVGTVMIAIIRQGPINRKLAQEREGNLLKERAIEMRGMRRRIIELEVGARADRHTINNLEQAVEMFLELVESQPERAKEWAGKVRQNLDRKRDQVAVEKAAIFAARIKSAEGDDFEEDKAA